MEIKDIFKKEQKKLKKYLTKYNKIAKVARVLDKEYNLGLDYKGLDSLRKRLSTFYKKCGLTENVLRLEETSEFKKAAKRKLKKSKYHIIGWQQNETPVNREVWKKLLIYKEYLGAEVSIILGRYKNPTSVFADKTHETWDKITQDYQTATTHDIHKYLTILGGVKISPTAKYPLTGTQGLAQGKSIILGHPKLHLKAEPVLNGYPKKVLLTTGAITEPNYTDSGAGAKSRGVHKFGFVIVEIKNNKVFFIRQVEMESNGDFTDLCHRVTDSGVSVINKAKALVCGDTHFGVLDPKIDKANDLICDYFNVDNVILHDLPDGESCNNHKIKSPIKKYQRLLKGEHLIEKELKGTADFLATKLKWNPVIVQANHNSRFDRVLDNDWRDDIHNSVYYMKYTQLALEGKLDKGVLAYYLEERFGDKVQCLDYKDSYILGKYECSQHGHFGSNGSRGNPRGFRNLEIPIILAHTHVPYRADDCMYVGTNTYLLLDYNDKGSSSWMHCNILIGENNLAQHLIFVDGEFTTFKLN